MVQNMSTQGTSLLEATKPKPDAEPMPYRPTIAPPPGWSGGLLTPETKRVNKGKQTSHTTNWSDFDPLI